MDRGEKQKIVASLKERLEKACGTFLVDYKGLNVEEISQLRREFKDADIDFQVVKNRLLSIASDNTDTSVLREYMVGPCGLVITYDDVVMPAKVLTRFGQDNEALEIKVGQINGQVFDYPAIKSLARLPSREQLLSQFVFTLYSIPSSLVRTLNEIPRSMVSVLSQVKTKKS